LLTGVDLLLLLLLPLLPLGLSILGSPLWLPAWL
jgi:hypothetical protein